MRSSPKVTYLKDYKVAEFLIDHVDLRFELDETKSLVKSRLQVRANPLSEVKTTDLALHGENLELVSVMLNGQALDATEYSQTQEGLIIHHVPEHALIEIQNTINPKANTALCGLYLSNHTFATHNEAQGFRRITYFLDRPDVMATYTTTIIADPKKYPVMLSNGNFKEEQLLPDGRRLICWDDPIKKPSYLFALVAGELAFLQDKFVTLSGREVDIKIYAKSHQIERCHHAMQSLKKAMKWDEENYGRECDLDSYKIVAIDDFNIGAMENKGLNIFNTIALLATPASATDERFMRIQGTVAHEYFHNWTGNSVTVRDWFQFSQKEGLTSYRDQAYSESMFSKAARATAVRSLRTRQFPEDAGPMAHPVRPESYITPDNFYTATIYQKGAEIFRMLQTWLGVTVFRRAMDLYFTRHYGQAVTIEQYLKALEDASGLDLTQFMIWFQQAGTPEVSVSEEYNADENTYALTFKQISAPTPGQLEKQPLPIPVAMGLMDSTGKVMPLYIDGSNEPQEETVLRFTESEQTFRFSHIYEPPVLSLFRNFSAPVKLHHNDSDHDLKVRMEFDSDAFNRVEAAQRYIMNHLHHLIDLAEKNEPLVLSQEMIEVFRKLLITKTDDRWLLAEMLTIPSESNIANQVKGINVEAIHAAREFIVNQITIELKEELADCYLQCLREEMTASEHKVKTLHEFNPKEAASRRLKNLCLGYLLTLREDDVQKKAVSLFNEALCENLTDTLAVLDALDKLTSEQRVSALSAFINAWQHEPLVLLYWFMAQASFADNAGEVKRLLAHPQFDIKNPNAVNALLRGFCENTMCFHAANGEGYRLLAETILQLDLINPKMSSSQVVYFTNWRRYDEGRKALMFDALKFMLKHEISKDLFELVNKCLGEDALRLSREGVPLKRIDGLFKVSDAVKEETVMPSTGMCVMQ